MSNLFPESTILSAWNIENNFFESEDNENSSRQSWQYDFEDGEFVISSTGKAVMVEGTEAWLQWCQKAIQTPRYRYIIYSRNYGQELEDLIGHQYGKTLLESEISRMAKEALLIDARTASVENFTFQWTGEKCMFTCEITDVYEETRIIQSEVIG